MDAHIGATGGAVIEWSSDAMIAQCCRRRSATVPPRVPDEEAVPRDADALAVVVESLVARLARVICAAGEGERGRGN